jgi:hypothetical protein
LYEEFEATKRTAEASSTFARVAGDAGGRFPLTGRGDVNTYALFAELFVAVVSKRGRAGVIVPTGIATDDSTKAFFEEISTKGKLIRLFDFENKMGIFPSVHRTTKFSLLTIGRGAKEIEFVFFAEQVGHLQDKNRRFSLSATDILSMNPNTKTAPIFRSRIDSELTARIYGSVPVLVDEAKGAHGNGWGVLFMRMFHMSDDSGLFRTAAQLRDAGFTREGSDWMASGLKPRQHLLELTGGRDERTLSLSEQGIESRRGRYVPLYEAKMCDLFDHRAASYVVASDDRGSRVLPESSLGDHQNPSFSPEPFYWVSELDVDLRLSEYVAKPYLLGFRDISTSITERSFIPTLFPKCGVGNSMPLLFLGQDFDPPQLAAFVSNLSTIVFDYVARQKMGRLHFNYFIVKQLPVLPPEFYSDVDLRFVTPRFLELTYTSHSMASFARDVGYDDRPFAWDEDRRANLRAELDAWYARAYGITRDDLRFILDPADVKGANYPSETFRVLKNNDIRRFGEYRTARLVLQAWDRLERGELAP